MMKQMENDDYSGIDAWVEKVGAMHGIKPVSDDSLKNAPMVVKKDDYSTLSDETVIANTSWKTYKAVGAMDENYCEKDWFVSRLTEVNN